MRPRKSHKKSKAGCRRCKHRKIKCDEQHPECGNCTKHGVPCDFDDNTIVIHSHSSRGKKVSDGSAVVLASPSNSASYATPTHQSPGSSTISKDSTRSRLLELRLLHNYTARTAQTLGGANVPGIEEAWQVSVPQLALESPCLMDAVLAVSALHLRVLCPEDTSLVRVFHSYMASAISQYSACLAIGAQESNAEALFVTSALIAFQALASRRFPEEEDEEQNSSGGRYALPTQWFHSFQGVKTVVLASWQWLRDSERVRPMILSQPALELDMNPSRPLFFGTLLEGLEQQLDTIDEARRADTKQAYEHAVACLNWSYQNPSRSRILGFPATVSRRFVELIEQKNPRALVIIACFFAMTRAVDGVWWLQGIAAKEVGGITSLLPEEWQHKMEWPRRVAQHEGLMTKEIWGDLWQAEREHDADEQSYGDVRPHIDILVQMGPGMPGRASEPFPSGYG